MERDATDAPLNEQNFSDELNRLNDRAKHISPVVNLKIFHGFLNGLPKEAGATIRFRAKANIGVQHLALGDGKEAVYWLISACDEAPDDPRSVAYRALAFFLLGDAEEAYRFGRDRLTEDPTNETLASYLPQFAVMVPHITDGLEGISAALREKESVIVGQAVFLRGRNLFPIWWEWTRSALERFPESENLRLLAATSHIDEIAHDEKSQRTRIFSVDQRERLSAAAEVLDDHLEAHPWLLKNAFDDAPQALANSMIAYRLLHDRDAALKRAKRIADLQLTDPDILHNAVIVAVSFNHVELAERLIALAPNDPNLTFHAGVIAICNCDLQKAATLFKNANIPEGERRVAETTIALASVETAARAPIGSAVDAAPMERLIQATLDCPRGLILIAQVASSLGMVELSEKAFDAAVVGVPEDCDVANRLMVASYAERVGLYTIVIRMLDHHLPVDGFEREHEGLAIAHANERPHRPRNLAYFDGLPPKLQKRHGIARAYASVLLDVGRFDDAADLLRRLHKDDPTDAFVAMRLVEVLHASNDSAGATSVVRALDLPRLIGPPEYVMVLAHHVLREGDAKRAFSAAYDLVRHHTKNAAVVLGYAGLTMLQGANAVFAMSVAETGAYVSVQTPDGTQQGFIIDEGDDFLGMRVLSPSIGIAARVIGLRCGDRFDVPKFGQNHPETWNVTQVASKYLHLYHRILEEFEARFPDKPGIVRFTCNQEDISSVLETIRNCAERNAELARIYIDQAVPLGVIARLLGGDVVSFAQYVRQLGGQIVTCFGFVEERLQAAVLARRYRTKGAVLDPYTTWVAAEIGALPTLKEWFKTLRTPASTIAMLDRMIKREDDGRGKKQMTVGYRDGRFCRMEITDDVRDGHIAALARARNCIVANCEIVPVLVPDVISEPAQMLLDVGGDQFLDAAFLAVQTGAILLSDDMRYRDMAGAAVECDATWIQSALFAACEARQLPVEDYARIVIGLAEHVHSHVALNGSLLYLIARQDTDDFPRLRAALRFLSLSNIEMRSLQVVFHHFLGLLWPPDKTLPLLKTQAATGLGLEAYLTNRKEAWPPLLNDVISSCKNPELSEYLAGWLRGHFITKEDLAVAVETTNGAQRKRPCRPQQNRRRRPRQERPRRS